MEIRLTYIPGKLTVREVISLVFGLVTTPSRLSNYKRFVIQHEKEILGINTRQE